MTDHSRSGDLAESLKADAPEQPAGVERWRPFPVDELPDPMRAFVLAVSRATATDASFAALVALATAAGAVGNRVAALVKRGWCEPCVLWAALVGRSGTTKSAVLKLVARPLYEQFTADRKAHLEAVREHENELERYAVAKAEWKAAQRDGNVSDPPLKPEAPAERRLIVADTTIEKLAELLAANPLGLLLVRDELAAWVGNFDRYVGAKGAELPTWLSFYDAAPVLVDRKSGGTVHVERGAVSIIGGIQPRTLARMFGARERESGLLGRILLACPPERPAIWSDAELGDETAAAWSGLLANLQAVQPAHDDAGGVRPRLLRLSEAARAHFIDWQNRHERARVDEDNDDLAAHLAKLKGAAVRLALLFACIDVADGRCGVTEIDADAMRRATAIVDWCKAESARVYGLLGESDDDRERRRLVNWITARGGRVTARELAQGPRRFRGAGGADLAEAELTLLAETGFGHWVNPAPGNGRPTRYFELLAAATATKVAPNPSDSGVS